MKFTVYNSYTQVSNINSAEEALIRHWCQVPYFYYAMDYSKKPFKKRKKKAFFSYFQDGKFPSGWAGKFYSSLKKQGINVTIDDQRVKPHRKNLFSFVNELSLRDYQQVAYDKAIQKGRGVIYHPTGSGKTILMAKIMGEIGVKSLIMVPDRNLLYQNYKAFEHFFGYDKVGIIGDGRCEIGQINVATVPSLWSGVKDKDPIIMDLLNEIDLLSVEEAHHISISSNGSPKNTYFKIAMLCNAYYRFGFTATPGKHDTIDRETLEAATGRIIDQVSTTYLINEGWLTPPDIMVFKVPNLDRISNWQRAYKNNIALNSSRNRIIAELAKDLASQGLSVLINVARVETHGKKLAQVLPEATTMYGSTPSEERNRIFEAFEKKEINILISSVIREGVDIPSMDAIIKADAGKDEKGVTQLMGRVIRIASNKQKALFIDFYDDDGGMLEKHSKKRIKMYKQEEGFNYKGIFEPYELVN